jgi:putative ABC transport system permease protein
MLRRVRSFWRALTGRSRFEREMDEELRFHLEERIGDLMRSGLPPGEAARRARLEFGNPEAWQDRCRESRGLGVVDALHGDVRFAWRSIRKNILVSATIVATLALGIGANTAMFGVLHSVLSPASYPNADRLVFLTGELTRPDHTISTMGWSYPKLNDLRQILTSFESIAAFAPIDVNVTGPGEAERVRAEIVTADYFRTLGVHPAIGDLFLLDGPDAPASVVLSEALWRRRFSADPAIVGTTVNLNRDSYTIVGVAPASFAGETSRAELWVSIAMTPRLSTNPTRLQQRMAHWLTPVARVRPGVTLERANEDLKQAVATMEAAQPSGPLLPDGRSAWSGLVEPLLAAKVDPNVRRSVSIVLASVACVLLVSCMNLASVLLGRGVARRRELAVRLAIGASRTAIVRQLLTESLLLAAIGGVLGLGIAAAGLRILTVLGFEIPAAPGAPFLRNVDLALVSVSDPVVVVYAVLLAIAAGVLFSLVPALQATRVDILDALKGSGTGWLIGRRRAGSPKLRRGLIGAQIALAVMLLAAAGLLLRTFDRLLATEIGVDGEGVLTFRVDLPPTQYTSERTTLFLAALTEALRSVPGVLAVAASNALPVQGQHEMTSLAVDRVALNGDAGIHMVGVEYFDALRIPLVRGRLLTDTDRGSAARVALINESTARRITLLHGDPLGRRISLGLNGWNLSGDAEIVGIVGDVKYQLLTMPVATDVYLSVAQRPAPRAFFVLRTSGKPATLVPAIRRRVAALDPALPIYAVRTMDEIVAGATAGPRFTSLMLGLFSSMALLIACVGLYGTLAHSIAARTREIGIRIALGAAPGTVARLVSREVAIVTLAGLAAGLLGARLMGRAVAGLLYQVEPTDPATLLAVSALIAASACLAGFLPARRATRISPLVALKEE